MSKKMIGSTLDSWLEEEKILASCEAKAIKQHLANSLAEYMKTEHITQTVMAERLHTSRTALKRVLDPANTSISLNTLSKVAVAMGKRLEVRLI